MPSGVKKRKYIIHLDGDAFFASVEVAKNPKLKGLPVVTGEERGIASSMSYEAKRAGVKRGMPIYQIKKVCPNVVIVHSDYSAYIEYSNRMMDIVREYTDDVEEYSIDECFADLTGFDRVYKKTYLEIMEEIQKRIMDELHISVSLGLSFNKVLAKVASKWNKPGGLTVIDKTEEFLSHTPIENLWGIGRQTASLMRERGIYDALAFSKQTEHWVRHHFNRHVYDIWQELNGVEVISISRENKHNYQSITRTETFFDYRKIKENDRENFLMAEFGRHIEDATRKARQYLLETKSIYFFLKDSGFKIKGIEVELEQSTNLPPLLISAVRKYFHKIYSPKLIYRTAGVTLLNLKLNNEQDFQFDLFGDNTKNFKIKKIYEAVDLINDKYGEGTMKVVVSNAQKPRGGFGKNF